MNLGRQLKKRDAAGEQWRGMQMFLSNVVPASDRRRDNVYEGYRKNLRSVVASGRRAGAKMILSTVVVNTRDCPPFAGIVTNLLTAGAKAELEGLLAKVAAAEQLAKWAAVTNICAGGITRFPAVAELHYRHGLALERLGQFALAKLYFNTARDMDALPFRADSRLNSTIREQAQALRGAGGVLCDAERVFAESSDAGPGAASFYEHVHLNFDGNYRLGRTWAEAVEQCLPGSGKPHGTWATQADCERLLGVTDWNRKSVVMEVLERLEQPPLSTQSNNGERYRRLKDWVQELEHSIQASQPAEARALYEAALEQSPEDYRLHENLAEFLEENGDPAGAIIQRRAVRELTPHYYFAHYILGKSLKQRKELIEARECLLKAAELKPDQPEVYLELGSVDALESKWESALAQFGRALRLDPRNSRLHQLSADVLWRMERKPEAIAALRRAVRIRPAYPEARYRLGEMLALTGNVADAATEFREVVRLRPDHHRARVNLGVALAQLGRTQEALREFDEVLRRDPNNAMARQAKNTAEGR
jgi:tetratricopeptide (TPR) repeat protein